MAEPQDAVLPIRKQIQVNLARIEAKVDNTGEKLLELDDKIEAMQGLMHYHLGMTNEQRHQIAELQKQMKDALARIGRLETSRA